MPAFISSYFRGNTLVMKKILVIEDNNDVRENISEILELAGYSVLQATNGKEGVEIAVKEHPDLIICDIMMPVLDGYGVLHLLAKNETTSGIPFIFLTAKTERADMRKGMEMGADDYLTKPFSDMELLSAIESRLKKTEKLKQDFSKDAEGLNEFLQSAKDFEDLKKLADRSDIVAVRKKGEIYREASSPRGVYYVNKGKVKTFRTSDLGKEIITGLYKEGDFFGYLALLQEEKYSDTAEAIEDTELSLITKEDFFDLIYRNAQVSKKFIRMLTDNVRDREEHLLKIAYNSVRKRIAEALLTITKKYGHDGEESFSMNIPREAIAGLSGTAIETTIRTLSDFKDEGLIGIKGSQITILQKSKLEKMKN